MEETQNSEKTAIFASLGRLGKAAAEELLEKGWSLSISFRPGRHSEHSAQELLGRYGKARVFTFAASLEDKKQADDFICASLERFDGADAVINVASGFPDEKRHWQRWQKGGKLTAGDWDFYETNFMVARNPTLSLLEKTSGGKDLSVIFFTDARSMLYIDENIIDPYAEFGGMLEFQTGDIMAAGIERLSRLAPPRHINPYTLAKVDLFYLTRVMAAKFAPRVRVNAIAPGPMLPAPGRSPEQSQTVIDRTFLKRWGTAAPIVKTINFLLENDFITAQTIKVDGGMHAYLKLALLTEVCRA
jgi:NAD(P)-dependent dehydrogenase (short-subunit alcohol dehydrogenase family)